MRNVGVGASVCLSLRAIFRRLFAKSQKQLSLGMGRPLIDVVGDAIAKKSFPTVVFHKVHRSLRCDFHDVHFVDVVLSGFVALRISSAGLPTFPLCIPGNSKPLST